MQQLTVLLPLALIRMAALRRHLQQQTVIAR